MKLFVATSEGATFAQVSYVNCYKNTLNKTGTLLCFACNVWQKNNKE
jgi:hypothetical protein